jgi:hypothetical protein
VETYIKEKSHINRRKKFRISVDKFKEVILTLTVACDKLLAEV